jgi:hypothetical protein
MSVRDGRIVLPDGMSYRVLVLPNRPGISLPVLGKLEQLVKAGATVIGPRPSQTYSLTGYPKSEGDVSSLVAELWGEPSGSATSTLNHVGKGRVISAQTAREMLALDGIKPDFDYSLRSQSSAPGAQSPTVLDYIHRADGNVDIYFVANRTNCWQDADCAFRVTGKAPELWDPVSGAMLPAAVFNEAAGHTTLRLRFAPYGSMFVIFRKPGAQTAVAGVKSNFPNFSSPQEITGPWTVQFDPKWGGPASVVFEQLVNWTQRPEEGIKYFSGTATYRKTFDLPETLVAQGRHLALDLGDVKNLAEVRLNGKNLGILWAPPFRVDVTDAIKPTGNSLEVEVVNFWPNRIIGDQFLPPEKRFTRTNIRKLTKDTPLMDSGLLGPVNLLAEQP